MYKGENRCFATNHNCFKL